MRSSIPHSFQNNIDGDVPLFDSHTPIAWPLEYSFQNNKTEQPQGQAPGALVEGVDSEADVTRIGSVLNNGKFMCDYERCAGQTFSRQAELRRHHTTIHAFNKPNFWCPHTSCRRSMSGGGEAFHRKDKLTAHIQSMHYL